MNNTVTDLDVKSLLSEPTLADRRVIIRCSIAKSHCARGVAGAAVKGTRAPLMTFCPLYETLTRMGSPPPQIYGPEASAPVSNTQQRLLRPRAGWLAKFHRKTQSSLKGRFLGCQLIALNPQ